MSISLFSKSPTVTVLDNRGLTVRDVTYHRHPDDLDVTDERMTHQQYNARGFLVNSADPRLYAAGLVDFTYLTDLTGSVLRTQGADNGTAIALSDAAGRPLITVNNIRTANDGSLDHSQAVICTWQYEDSTLPGRPLSATEQVTGEAARITERFVYAGNTDAEWAFNLAGQCVSHYDTAGLVQTDSVALIGVPLSNICHLLKDADNPDAVADWQGADVSTWNDLLDGETYITQTTADVTGAVLTTTDARGNVQRVAYDVAGLLSGSWLTLKDGQEQVIVKSLTYSAAGQKLREEHGNGVVTTYTYEAKTQRLTGIKIARPTGHVAGAKVLQDLRYDYDPVGNVLSVKNDAEETRFWRNQKVVPENKYAYDSLYQLVRATGREMANAGQQGSNSPSATVPLPTDGSAYTNYTRTYTYDTAGNLAHIKHCAPATNNIYTTNITVSDRSNRGVLSTLTENPAEVDALFIAGGQQKQLQPGQRLIWTPRNELLKVTPVVRDGSTDDGENYRYDGGSQRILKVSRHKTNASAQTKRVLYLGGLELRATSAGDRETERLQVICVGEAGSAQVRVLHWESGQPEGIANDQVRWSYGNLTGSSGLEVDSDGNIISMEEYYPYGGTAIMTARSQMEAEYKTVRYSGKERDATGLYYYGYRYYQPWVGRWLSADPAGTLDGLNLFRMVRNNPVTFKDTNGLVGESNTAEYRTTPRWHDSNFNKITEAKRETFFAARFTRAPGKHWDTVNELSKSVAGVIARASDGSETGGRFLAHMLKDTGVEGQYGRISKGLREINNVIKSDKPTPQTLVKKMLIIKSVGAYIIDHASKTPDEHHFILGPSGGAKFGMMKERFQPAHLFNVRGRAGIVAKENRADVGILDQGTVNTLGKEERDVLLIPGLSKSRPLFRTFTHPRIEGSPVESPFVNRTFDNDLPLIGAVSGSTACIMIAANMLKANMTDSEDISLAKASVAFLVGGGYHSATEVLDVAYPGATNRRLLH